MTRVPDTINANVEDAQKWLKDAALQVTQAGTVYSPGLPENVVLAQDVSAGSVVMKNTMLSLTVSTGKEIYQMPDLTGMTEDYARQALECMGVAVTMQDGEKNGVSAGCVTAQSIEPYAEIGTGDEVTLTVSRGIRGTDGAAPYLVGLSYENALGAAAEAGLTLTVTRKEFSHDCAEPTIKTQAVQASETAADGTVGVELLMPWHSFQMPNLNYKTEGDAAQILANMGVHANVSQESNELIAAGLVFAQDRAKGETLEPGDTVAITVSTGGKPFAMPSIVGMSESEAKKLLAEAGFNDSHPLSFNLLYNTSESHQRIAIAASSMWKKNLGVEAKLQNQEWKTMLDTMHTHNFDAVRYAWIADYDDAATFLNNFRTGDSQNTTQYSNPDYDRALVNAAKSKTAEERGKFYQQAEDLLGRDVPAIPVYHYVRTHLVKPWVGGFTPDKLGYYYTKDMYIKKH